MATTSNRIVRNEKRPFLATKIDVEPSNQFELVGRFQASHPPQVHRHKSIDVELHEYEGNVTWTAPLKISENVDPSSLTITGQVFAQACYDKGCLPPQKYAFKAEYKPTRARRDAAGTDRPSGRIGSAEQAQTPPNEATRKNGPHLNFDQLEAEGGSIASLPL